MPEPSVLAYLKSILKFEPSLNVRQIISNDASLSPDALMKKGKRKKKRINWGVVAGSGMALLAQYFLEPTAHRLTLVLLVYGLAAFMIWTHLSDRELVEFDQKKLKFKSFSMEIRLAPFAISVLFATAAFLFFHENTFTIVNVMLWLAAIFFFLVSVWEVRQKKEKQKPNLIAIGLLLLILGISAFFRFHQLASVPAEMFSDHAEKLLDVMDVQSGKTSIFFPRNTGREALQFYLTAAIIKVFNTGIGFLSLKIGTALAGMVTLVFIYLLGKKVANVWVGLLAMLMAGVAYWPNVISRVALRYAFYPLFAAPVLYFLLKGLKERNRNDLVICGLLVGFGLHGYSPARIIPILILLAFLIYWLHQEQTERSSDSFMALCLLAFAAFISFLPLFRYFLENPDIFSYRALSRLASIEKTLQGSTAAVFFMNLWKSSIMVFYDNGQIWVHSIPHRPALDFVTAAFFFVGLVYEIRKYFKYRDWQTLVLLVSIPVLMLPSILSIAFPAENPSLNRSGAAYVPVFVIAAIGVYQCLKVIGYRKEKVGIKVVVSLIILGALVVGGFQNYDLVFRQYAQQFSFNAWNSSEMGQVVASFVKKGNSYQNAFVVPFPHWVDTRLVGINAGLPGRDLALWPQDFELSIPLDGNKLFILKPEDTEGLEKLKLLYPQGGEEVFYSRTAGKNFIMYSINPN